mmetsp:Transcript_12095/g.35598  ORF Transcript_12095/g.35598 Transcript_12095/m.35598 type:complete len:210 (+) Transcript_12095:43-672(+)
MQKRETKVPQRTRGQGAQAKSPRLAPRPLNTCHSQSETAWFRERVSRTWHEAVHLGCHRGAPHRLLQGTRALGSPLSSLSRRHSLSLALAASRWQRDGAPSRRRPREREIGDLGHTTSCRSPPSRRHACEYGVDTPWPAAGSGGHRTLPDNPHAGQPAAALAHTKPSSCTPRVPPPPAHRGAAPPPHASGTCTAARRAAPRSLRRPRRL